jgi:hypothetical protein
MKLTILAAIAGSAAAFSPPSASSGASPSARHMSTTDNALNGWTADAALPCYGLPGAPYSFMDPLGFTKNTSLNTVKRLREAEVMHGRVAMMATVGYLIGESTPTIAYGMDVHHTIANNQLSEVPTGVLLPLFLAINFAEAFRASAGWAEPGKESLWTLRETYYPGDLGFDPFGFKPTDAKEFSDMQDGELSNGRLAMLAVAIMCAQEQVTGQGILESLGAQGVTLIGH